MKPHQIIKRPLLTEKSNRLKETGGSPNASAEDGESTSKVLFEVHDDANKIQIKAAVEELFKVTVADVNTLVVRGKPKRMGRRMGKTRNWKKAFVTLSEGTIEYFEGA